MSRIALAEGRRAGITLGGFVLLVAVLGLAPAFSWLPEAPLVTVAVAVPLVGLVVAGFLAWRRTGRIVAGVVAGALAGGITGLVAGLAYLGLDQIFIDTVSKQPDKIVNFPASGFSTMRDYLLSHDSRNVPVGVAVGALGGALLGWLGAGLAWVLPATRSRAQRPGGAPAPRP